MENLTFMENLEIICVLNHEIDRNITSIDIYKKTSNYECIIEYLEKKNKQLSLIKTKLENNNKM